VHIRVGEQTMVSTVPGISALRRGDSVWFNIARGRLHLFDPVTGTRLRLAQS
jgi:hypothetical protein